MIPRLFVTLLLLVFSFQELRAQDFSNKGKDFWLAYPGHIDGNSSRMALYISSTVNTSGTVALPGGATIPFTVTANQATVVQVFPSTYNVINPQSEGISIGKGIHITALQPVVVYAHILNQARSGSTLVLPTNTLGREYIAASYRSMVNSQPPPAVVNGSPSGSQFTIVAVEENTTVEITPTVPDAGGVRAANTPFTVILQKGDVYQYRSSFSNDVTGTRIRTLSTGTGSCKPIAVFSGSSWASLDCNNAGGGDNLFLQLMPKSAWGRNYVTAPFADRQYDIFRVVVSDPATVVTLNGTPLNPLTLVNGTYYQFSSSSANVITADQPVMLIQYMISQTCDSRNGGSLGAAPYPGDPEMIIINPIEQTLNDITVVSARNNLTPPNTNITKHFFTIIMKSNATASLRIDGLPPSSIFIPIGTSGYSYLQENVTASTNTNPSHRIKADSGFIALAYGLGNVESYGYNAGTNVIDLYQYVSLRNQYATVNFPATCVGAPFKFSITLPYQAQKIRWDFTGAASSISPNTAVQIDPPTGSSVIPADSSFVKDGKTLYVYKLASDYSFSAAGTYPVKVLVNNPTPDGCSGDQEISYDVVVYPEPVADWTVSSNGCLTEPAQFNDATNGNGRTVASWVWDFGDGNSSTVKNPLKTYTTPGSYNVKLTAITDIGCITDTTKTFTVTPAPVAKFGVDSPRCAGATLVFTDSSTIGSGSITKWTWDFGNGNTVVNTTNAAVTQVYPAAGTYNVTLQVESSTGCKSTLTTMPLQVGANPVVDFSIPSAVCLPVGAAPFTDLSTIADGTQNQFSYRWYFGDGDSSSLKNPVHHYSATGPFDVKLRVTSNLGCSNELVKPITTIFPRPTASFTWDPELCLRDSAHFVNTSSATSQVITNWNWNFGDGGTSASPDPAHLYTIADTFDVKLFVVTDKGCLSDTMVRQVIVHPLPEAAFTYSSPLCEARDVIFTSQSQANAGSLTKWSWSFGDGGAQTQLAQAPLSHVFAAAGDYQVKLAVESSKGCKSDTLTKTLQLHHLPVANFIKPEVCLNDSYAQFLDSSHIADATDSMFTYAWHFGDPNASASNPNTSTLKHPTHKYTALGNYTASLKVTSVNGCADSVSKVFTVNGSFPVADFAVLNASALCSNTDVTIRNLSTVAPGDITKIEIYWDFGNQPAVKETDDFPALNKTYSHRYPDFQFPLTRTFQVKLRAYSGSSCLGETTKTITVNASPKTSFVTIPGICHDAAPRQVSQASEAGGLPKASDLFTGTGISSTGLFNPAGAGPGTYYLQYLFVSTAGCRDSASQPITVWPSPTAKFGVSQPLCEKNEVTFNDSSVANFGNITSWTWDFGNGSASHTTAAPFQHLYNLAGTYNATLRVETDSGCRSTVFSKTLAINHLPRVDFNIPSVCLPDGRGTFTDASTIPDGTENLFSYRWNFGDPFNPNPSTQKNPTHQYSGLGPYQVKLRVTSAAGCTDSLTKPIPTIYPQPRADFYMSPAQVCLGAPFSFTDGSNGNGGAVVAWNWSFGDGSANASTQNPSHTYTDNATYLVSLSITNDKGCPSDTMVKQARVNGYPVVNAGPDLFVLEDGYAILSPVVTGSGLSYLWSPGEYLDNPNIKNPRFTPGQDQLYRLTVRGTGGCEASDEVFIKVLKSPVVPNAFSPNGDGINDTWNIQYLDSYPGCTVELFDRYGKLLFTSYGYSKPWDGKLNGRDLPVGVYYYIINPKNGKKPFSGMLTLLR